MVELGFHHLISRVRACLLRAHIPLNQRYKLWTSCALYVTDLDEMVVETIGGETKTCIEHSGDKIPGWMNSPKVWGEAGTVKTFDHMTPKLKNKGIHCMFIGYSTDRSEQCFNI